MTFLRWADSTREQLRAVLPDALVVLPFGATEQHGPHLATGTDALLAGAVAARATEAAAPLADRPLVLAPCLPFGASDHHLPFGGTLSLSVETATAVLGDLARSVVAGGGRRLLVVNGHGGNRGVCHAAASGASSRYGLAVSVTHYWDLLPADPAVPGHAGRFETSMVLAVDETLVAPRRPRPDPPAGSTVDGVDQHDPKAWLRIDGYTDHPELADAAAGAAWLEQAVSALSARLIELARM
ncbi:creatininase family protein [Amycolatopsis suaedae]|uniref:Creatininase family protein n=1 Tax=Amycolatopsis suaedae TaxID=2510978 RepID=A0A4Q7JCD6_9PSEU|nr:creatininase family protein [Amycolatopsis suaedae]RZQ65571.1 creatininase family protein [Amycolatopsis suaedae]